MDPYIHEFDDQLRKVFTVYYYSSAMESERAQIAALTDDDFTSLGGLQQIRWSPSQHRAIFKLDKNFTNLTQHCESVAANSNHDRKEECEGVLGFLTSVKFLKMVMFMLDLHGICQVLSKLFQREDLLIIEVAPLLNKAYLALENLRGGKGQRMLEFTATFVETGKYKGTDLTLTEGGVKPGACTRLEWSNFWFRIWRMNTLQARHCSVHLIPMLTF